MHHQNLRRFRYGLVALLLLLSTAASAATSVWQVSKGKHTLYLAGTFHLLNSADHPLPDAFEQAYLAADTLIFETDVSIAQSPEYQRKAAALVMFQDGRTLDTAIKPTTYAALEAFLTKRSLPVETFAQLTPVGVSLMLSSMELQRLGMSAQQGVEYTFNLKASVDNKQRDYLETPEEQLQFISRMGQGEEDDMLLYTLEDLLSIETELATMKRYWLTGDVASMDSHYLQDMRTRFPRSYQDLLVSRNNAWLPHIESMVKSDGTELVMVGAMHLPGPDGLLAQLQARGYQLEQQ
ncbi:TraB/GumN family protein [Teredinibacter turnerae]|uniref:TraB/GumN family protein n=1 Tax=Teredinibacter turnerae TaxID=2426 RepID=UPI0004904A7A|nr:TraB/GumN family protein [Teredinibacter turnerae]